MSPTFSSSPSWNMSNRDCPAEEMGGLSETSVQHLPFTAAQPYLRLLSLTSVVTGTDFVTLTPSQLSFGVFSLTVPF